MEKLRKQPSAQIEILPNAPKRQFQDTFHGLHFFFFLYVFFNTVFRNTFQKKQSTYTTHTQKQVSTLTDSEAHSYDFILKRMHYWNAGIEKHKQMQNTDNILQATKPPYDKYMTW